MENVLVVYICHLCQKGLSTSCNLRDHISGIHKLNFEYKSKTQKRGNNFNKFISKKFINSNPEVKYFRRSCCHQLFDCIKELGKHFFNHILSIKRPIEEGTSSNSNSNNYTNKKISLNKGNQYDNNGNEIMDVQMEVDNEMHPIEKVTNFDIYIDLKPSEKEAKERNNSSAEKSQMDDKKGSYKHYKDVEKE
ncbi:hypothetical protein G6F37_000786 [Rhizopus arrhizus]|nr:hypothetical protein G6F38_001885 [Rhizopus arrhizus]KAG1163911.1 hypothetical protein G6F37_000786 [Rhizopus arrhizus]